jgi:hypothetical protein
MSNWSGRWERIRLSTTPRRTLPKPTRPTTSFSTRSATVRFPAAKGC